MILFFINFNYLPNFSNSSPLLEHDITIFISVPGNSKIWCPRVSVFTVCCLIFVHIVSSHASSHF